ncbi:DUF805 domain-containing protein [Veillonella sp. AS16]|uniref:DUF805 domain-containing protein n=1 Tax=Veillonella sp. AS16 TaxID=936589 RepID=UPI001E554241|nr:DUF805 domain-containing protein [Veillonella sp. AS16]
MERVAYIFAIVGTVINIYIYLFLIALLGSLTNSPFVKILPYILIISGMIVIFISLVRRLNDIGLARWVIIIVLTICFFIKLTFNNYDLDGVSFFEIISIFDLTKENFFIVIFLMLFSLPPGEAVNNIHGYAYGVNKIDNYFVAYGNNTSLNNKVNQVDFFDNVYRIYFAKLFYISGRANRREYFSGVIGGNFVSFILMFLFISFSKFSIDIFNVSLIRGTNLLMVYIWPGIGIITLSLRRLHDCLLSSLWIAGLVLPFVNVFVLYHLLLKKSWYFTIKPNF